MSDDKKPDARAGGNQDARKATADRDRTRSADEVIRRLRSQLHDTRREAHDRLDKLAKRREQAGFSTST